jgi:hypothetical protein
MLNSYESLKAKLNKEDCQLLGKPKKPLADLSNLLICAFSHYELQRIDCNQCLEWTIYLLVGCFQQCCHCCVFKISICVGFQPGNALLIPSTAVHWDQIPLARA